jgi:hypothetical protein
MRIVGDEEQCAGQTDSGHGPISWPRGIRYEVGVGVRLRSS